jgi:hypothetical protein
LQAGALSDREIEEKMVAIVGADTVACLKSANWKDRLAAMENVQQCLKQLKENLDISMLIQVGHAPWLRLVKMTSVVWP